MKKYNKLIINGIKLIIFGLMIFLFIYFGTKDYENDIQDNVRFASDYKDISKNNVFKYIRREEMLNLITKGNGVIFLGFPDNIWSHYYADYLNQAALLNELDLLYYYDFKKDRSINNGVYEKIVQKLSNYLIKDDQNRMDLQAPSVVVVKDGQIIYFNDEVQVIKGDMDPANYFNDYKKNYLLAEFSNAIKLYKGELD